MKPVFKIAPISVDALLERKEQEYNPQIWKDSVRRMSSYDKCQFYVIEPDKVYSYARFFVSYIADGIYFFSNWNAFSSCLSGAGFCKVTIDDEGNVFKHLFNDGKGNEGYAKNDNRNRESFRKNYTPIGIMVSNCI